MKQQLPKEKLVIRPAQELREEYTAHKLSKYKNGRAKIIQMLNEAVATQGDIQFLKDSIWFPDELRQEFIDAGYHVYTITETRGYKYEIDYWVISWSKEQ